MKKYLILATLCLFLPVLAQAQGPNAPYHDYKVAVGVLGTYQAIGVQSEFKLTRQFVAKAIGALSFDNKRRAGEHAGAGIGLLTYYIPTTNRFIEPAVGVGGVYSWYHWELHGGSGTIHDVNVGAAFGTNLRFSNRFRSGLNLFIGNGFRADYVENEMSIVGRKLLVLPTLTVDFLL